MLYWTRISYVGQKLRKDGGFAINDRWNTHTTGQLDRRTLLHKRYLIQRVIGQGGMGAVYQAKDLKRQGAVCAIKEMSLSMVPAEEQAQAIQNFKIEAKILWGLNHPNLPSFTGFFSENQRYFLVMEFVDGSTLEDLLERNGAPFSERRVLGWARQLCDVLEYLHSQNPPIIFRDMKPGNVMLMRNGHIKLIDFGIARFFRSTSSQDTQLLGTPGFAPPEQYGKAQTDERSDVYSLAMTLFQLLTNTLSETGFGLKDVRAINPQISPSVARALEKATALDPDERYESVAAFRRALLGVGTFVFDNGDQATNPEELADLCARYPEEASDYLAAGEVELWLHEIGENDLARAARRIRITGFEPQEAVEQFLRVVMGRNGHLRGYTGNGSREATGRMGRNWLRRNKEAPPIQVNPHILDFGAVYPGVSGPQTITISGDQGLVVSGTIQTNESWIMLDTTQFDGMMSYVNVRVNSTHLRGATHYTGTVAIVPHEQSIKEIMLTVEVEVQSSVNPKNGRRRGKTIGADLDEYDDDDEDELTIGSPIEDQEQMMAPQTLQPPAPLKVIQPPKVLPHVPPKSGPKMPPTMPPKAYPIPPTHPAPSVQPATTKAADRTVVSPTMQAQINKYQEKYSQPGLNGAKAQGWDPWQATPGQRLWHQRGLTLVAAFMLASLVYTLLSQLSPLPPNPWFIAVLAGMAPAATLGALLVNWKRSWPLKETINRAIAGMSSVFLLLGLIRVLWQILVHGDTGIAQLLVMLLVAATGATIGTYPRVSAYVLSGASWLMKYMRWLAITTAVLVGGIMGYFLTLNLALSCFTPFAILFGIGIAVALVWRVDNLLKKRRP